MAAPVWQESDFALFDKGAGAPPPGGPALMAALKESGAVICRGYLDTMEDFIEFSDRFTRNFVPYVGGANNGRALIRATSAVYTVTEPSMKVPLPLHSEMYYTPNPPDLVWFFCITPAAANGETTMCDGRKILAGLSPATRRLFEEREVIYRRNFTAPVWRHVYQTDDIADVEAFCRANELALTVHPDGGISTVYRASAIVRSPGGDAFVNSVLNFAAHEYLAGSSESQVRWSNNEEIDRAILMEVKTVSDGLTVAHKWRPGEVIVIDNARVMHGRRAFDDDRRNIVVRLGMMAS